VQYLEANKDKKGLPKSKEPVRPKTHWDFVIEEMTWLAKVGERVSGFACSVSACLFAVAGVSSIVGISALLCFSNSALVGRLCGSLACLRLSKMLLLRLLWSPRRCASVGVKYADALMWLLSHGRISRGSGNGS